MEEQLKLNRIILIGNGFDRSLGMPTSYSHFLDWARLEAIKSALENKPSQKSKFVQIITETNLFKVTTDGINSKWIKELIQSGTSWSSFEKAVSSRKKQAGFNFSIVPLHPFMDELMKFYGEYKWVDIEQMYFNKLLITKKEGIIGFHQYFGLVKEELLKYLKTLSINRNQADKIMPKYNQHFFSKILRYDSSLKKYEETDKSPAHFYFVNFNYTKCLTYIMDHAPENVMDDNTINHIHGDLNEFPIIFGYGNEKGENYTKLESLGNDYLDNIKSTHYFNSTHYRDLETQLNHPYEVYVYGLSCGLSDQILLNTIMQKPHCKQIRIFYNKYDDGKDNYRETLMNISRVFDDKELMRSKIIPKQQDDYIRQIENAD